MAAQLQALCAQVGMDLTDAEVERMLPLVQERLERPPAPSMIPFAGPSEVTLEMALSEAGTGPFSAVAEGTNTSYIIGGTVAAGYEGVKEAFASNFQRGLERDAQLCIVSALAAQ